MNRLALALVLVLSALSLSAHAATTPESGLAGLKFLLGDWVADAKPGEATGSCSFKLDVQDTVMVRRNHAEYPAANGRPAGTHEDLVVIYQEGAAKLLHAVYFDSEGHTIRYAVDAGAAGQVTFLSEAVAGQPSFRLTYNLMADGRVSGKFEIAPTGKADAFAPYLEWVLKKGAAKRPSKP